MHLRRRRKPASMAIKVRAGPNIEAIPMPRTLDHTHTDVDRAERPQTMRAHRRMSMQHTVDLHDPVLTVPNGHDDREPNPQQCKQTEIERTRDRTQKPS